VVGAVALEDIPAGEPIVERAVDADPD